MATVQTFFEGCDDLESLSSQVEALRQTLSVHEEADDIDWVEIEAYRELVKEKKRLDTLIDLDLTQDKLKEVDVKAAGIPRLMEAITTLVSSTQAASGYDHDKVVWELNESSQAYVNKIIDSALSMKLPKLTAEQLRQVEDLIQACNVSREAKEMVFSE